MAPSRTVSNSTSVTATCGPWRVPAGVVQNVPASQRLPPVSIVPDSTSTNSSAGWVWTGMVVPAVRRARWMDPSGHRLGERHEFDARQKVDRQPRAGARIGEGLMVGHCGSSESW
jgi:hypothetical protein